MAQTEIEAVRALLASKPRPVGWPQRRKRLDDVGSVWPVADDVNMTGVDVNGVPGEWSIVPRRRSFSRSAVFPRRRLLLGFNPESSSHEVRRRADRLGYRTVPLSLIHLPPKYPSVAVIDDALTAWHFCGTKAHCSCEYRHRWRQRRGRASRWR